MKKPRFEVKRSEKDKQFYFVLKAPNNKIILQSEGYRARSGADKAIKSIIKNAAIAEVIFLRKKRRTND